MPFLHFLSFPVGGCVGGFDASTTGGWIEGCSPDPSPRIDECIDTSETKNRDKKMLKGRKTTVLKNQHGGFLLCTMNVAEKYAAVQMRVTVSVVPLIESLHSSRMANQPSGWYLRFLVRLVPERTFFFARL